MTSLAMFLTLSGCSINENKMTNLEIVKSTYEGKTSQENGKNLAKYVADDISWTEAKGFPYAGTYIGLKTSPRMFSVAWVVNGLITNLPPKTMLPVKIKWWLTAHI